MISYLLGTVRGFADGAGKICLITRGGVGYDVTLPVIVWKSLKDEGVQDGSELALEIYYHVTDRQPRPVLVGFRNGVEKGFFEQLIEVEGIGPNKASAALVLPVQTIASAIEREDFGTLRRLPGIGDRAAQKIVATLRGKVMQWAIELPVNGAVPGESVPVVAATGAREEAIAVLVNLGHKAAEARISVDEALTRRPDLADNPQELMREIFRSLAKTT
ncbi:MAG: Holliday junction DNA helicase RuvA [Chloroflexi bacterium]|nr:Holliday junction DNA helicase RuvA [Chloroflexota bacterium]